MPSSFRNFLWLSAIIHISVFLGIQHSPDFHRIISSKKHKVTWVRLTKGKGQKPSESPFKKAKGMPYWTIREQKMALKEKQYDKEGKDKKSFKSPIKKKKVEKKKPTKRRVAKDGAVNFKPRKKKRQTTIDKALARVQEQLQQREIEIEAAQIEKEGEGQSPYGSLDVQKGESNPVLIAYYESVKRKINREWITTPKKLEEGQRLRAQISVEINSNGTIRALEYYLKSGDLSFDMSAKRAIERSAPFPSPPKEIRNEVIGEGFLIEFNPRSVVGRF